MVESKNVLITGCSTGIGRALAEEFARRGHRVFATARRIESLDGLDGAVEKVQLDVNDPPGIHRAVQHTLDTAGSIDILINNAGYGQMGPTLEIPLDRMRQQFETNVTGQLAVIQAVAPAMIERRRGVIVNVSSISGILVTPFAGPYCASKAAFTALSEALRMELAPFGVKVVIVEPGGVRSSFGDNATSQLDLAEDSRYAPIVKGIRARANASQANATPAERVARDIADAAVRPEPPYIVRTGNGALKYPAFKRWLPARTLDRMLMKRFGLDRL